jgi:hypothetical protein
MKTRSQHLPEKSDELTYPGISLDWSRYDRIRYRKRQHPKEKNAAIEQELR